ncbi:hypothetical protein OIO90_004031 [Microbotryomycetes sp. JL221]|nr:hypothetical protein OIO90_004031 [Microbotryomycetes sp. JL221]
MPGVFAQTLQPGIISLFSSTSSQPLSLATRVFASSQLTQDSFVSILHDDTDDEESIIVSHDQHKIRNVKFRGSDSASSSSSSTTNHKPVNIRSKVLHIQAPDVRSTGVEFGSLKRDPDGLGIQANWLHLSVKDVGQMFYFDVGVVDERGTRAEPKVYTSSDRTKPILINVPLRFPTESTHRLTHWCTISLNLAQLLVDATSFPAYVTSSSSSGQHNRQQTRPIRFAKFSQLLCVQVHANCRLRRIWCTSEAGGVPGDGMILRGWQTELGLFAAEPQE